MSFSDRFAKVFSAVLPAPFTIAIILSVITFVIALFFTSTPSAQLEFSSGSVLPGEEIVITAVPDGTYAWSDGSTGKTVAIAAKSDARISLDIKSAGYVSSLLVTFTEGKGRLGPVVEDKTQSQFLQVLQFWETGMWEKGLLAFAVQMMLMLVLGHALALSKPVNKLIMQSVKYCNTTANAAAIVTLLTVLVSLFNWGLGLIFGAIFARKVAEYAKEQGHDLNYPLIGAAGYSGLMVWHGGVSGSSLAKVAEGGHLKSLMTGVGSPEQLEALPDTIPFEATVFSGMNITISLVLLIVLPLCMYLAGKKIATPKFALPNSVFKSEPTTLHLRGAEKLDHSKILSISLAAIILFYAFYKAFIKPEEITLAFITPNYINLVLLGLCLALHGSFHSFLKGVEGAIGGAAGILIQFPLYFGIMGMMKGSGLVVDLSEFFVSISNEVTYPIFTFFSAGIVNVFVPSGGGQWMVQGPIIIQSSTELGIPLAKSIMALAYGDQLTNMMQPFWALPLLGITGLKAKEIIPYTLFLMLLGTVIFIAGLLIF